MKLTKRILCLVLMLTLMFALCACGEDEEDQKSSGTNPGGFSTPSENSVTQTTDDWAGNLDGENQYNDGMFTEW